MQQSVSNSFNDLQPTDVHSNNKFSETYSRITGKTSCWSKSAGAHVA